MSLFTFSSGLLTMAPKITVEDERVTGHTSTIFQLLTLFFYGRSMVIDKSVRRIEVTTRIFWVVPMRTVCTFDEVAYVDSDYASMGTSWGWMAERNDEVDKFATYIVLKGGKKISLFTFSGEGAVQTGWQGILLGGDNLFDAQGNQDALNRQFLVLLKHFIGCTIGKPVPHLANDEGTKFACTACGRPSPPRKGKCLYCGGETGPA